MPPRKKSYSLYEERLEEANGWILRFPWCGCSRLSVRRWIAMTSNKQSQRPDCSQSSKNRLRALNSMRSYLELYNCDFAANTNRRFVNQYTVDLHPSAAAGTDELLPPWEVPFERQQMVLLYKIGILVSWRTAFESKWFPTLTLREIGSVFISCEVADSHFTTQCDMTRESISWPCVRL